MKKIVIAIALLSLTTSQVLGADFQLKKALEKAPDRPGNTTAATHCGSILTCNVLIAKCEEWGGTWTETGTPGPRGEPQKGTCVH